MNSDNNKIQEGFIILTRKNRDNKLAVNPSAIDVVKSWNEWDESTIHASLYLSGGKYSIEVNESFDEVMDLIYKYNKLYGNDRNVLVSPM